MRIQFPTTETGSSPLLIDGLWFESVPPPGGTKIDPPDNTGTTPSPEPEEEDEEEEEDSGTGSY